MQQFQLLMQLERPTSIDLNKHFFLSLLIRIDDPHSENISNLVKVHHILIDLNLFKLLT